MFALMTVLVLALAPIASGHALPHVDASASQISVDRHQHDCDGQSCQETGEMNCCAMISGQCSSLSSLLSGAEARIVPTATGLVFAVADRRLRGCNPEAEPPPPRS
ncbi:MAG: hypothetical protein Kilf2KO_35670 [Rhodospirillales bacterium]